MKLYFFPVSEQKLLFFWRETFSAWFSKLLSSCSVELSLEKLNCFEMILLLMLIVVPWADTTQIFHKNFRPNFWDSILCVQTEILKEKSFFQRWNFWWMQSDIEQKCVGFWQKTFGLVVKAAFFVSWRFFLRKMKGFTKIFLPIQFSGLWVEVFRACGEKNCGRLFKKAFCIAIGMIWGKLSCWRPIF